MHRPQRYHDAVFICCCLQLEIERLAEALAQRETPAAVDTTPKGRMDYDVHVAHFIEKAFHDYRVASWHRAQRGHSCVQVFHHLRRSRVRQADGVNTPLHRRACRLVEY